MSKSHKRRIPLGEESRAMHEGRADVGSGPSPAVRAGGVGPESEEALHLKSAYFDNILRGSTDQALATTDLELRITYFNPLAEQLLGHQAEAVIGRRLTEIHLAEGVVPERLKRAIENVRRTREHRFALERDTSLGRRIIEARVTGIWEPDGTLIGYAFFATDVTEKRRAEEGLRLSEERYRELFTNIPIGVYRTTPDGRIENANPYLVELLGYSRFEELARHNLEEEGLASEYNRRDFRERIERDGFVAGLESRWKRRDGSVVMVRENAKAVRNVEGRVIGYEGTIEDITERRRAEEALRAERDFNTSLVQASPTFFVAISADGRTLMMNASMLAALGYTEDEVKGTPYLDTFVPKADRAELAHIFDELVRRRKPTRNENRVLAKDGQELLVEWHGRPVFKENGEFDFFFGVGIDITERRRLEEQYRQSQKMEALGLLAGGIAHDFNNLLTAMLGNAEFVLGKLTSEPNVDQRYVTCLGAAVSAANRAVSLARQLLAFGRGHAVKPVVLNLNEVVTGMEELLPRVLGERIRLRVDTEPALGAIEADPAQIEQIIMNLAVNARDAMPNGGNLSIKTANVVLDENEAARHSRARAGKYAALLISDTGTGMSAATIERIFEPFFTTKPVGQGTGLGLATVFGIVKQSRGFVTVDSALGEGSVFAVRFPVVDRPEEPAARPSASAASGRDLAGEETILVCEDEESIRRLAAEVLGYHGYTVLTAENGRHAMEVAAAYGDIIHLLLTDVVMPEMNGRELAEALRAERPATKVLFMSGYSSEVLGAEPLEHDGLALLEKPFSSSELLIRVRRMLDERP